MLLIHPVTVSRQARAGGVLLQDTNSMPCQKSPAIMMIQMIFKLQAVVSGVVV